MDFTLEFCLKIVVKCNLLMVKHGYIWNFEKFNFLWFANPSLMNIYIFLLKKRTTLEPLSYGPLFAQGNFISHSLHVGLRSGQKFNYIQ